MAFAKGANSDELFYVIPELNTRKVDNYNGFYTSPAVGPFGTNYIYATTNHLIYRPLSISVIIPATYIITSLVRYFINGLSGRNCLVDVNKLRSFFLFNTYNAVMKTLEATTQLGGFNQRLPKRQYNKCFPYRGPHQHGEDSVNKFPLLCENSWW